MKLITTVFAVFLVMVMVGDAHADEREQAKAHFVEGTKHYNVGEFADALEEFKQAYFLLPDAAFLYNLGQCARQLGDYESAEKSYRAFLRESPQLPPERRDEVERMISVMQAAAREQRRQPPKTETPVRATSAPPPVAAPVPTVDRGKSKRLAGIITADVGVGGVALGAIFAGLSFKAGNDAYHPSSGVYNHSADVQQTNFRNADIACFVIGGAAVVVGTTLWLLGRRARHSRAAITPTGGRGIQVGY